METEPLFKPDRSEDASGIVLKTAFMQHADHTRPKIALSPIGVEQLPERGAIQLNRHRIDREIPPGEILFDRRWLNRRQESGLGIGLSPGGRDIHLESVWKREPRGREPFKYRQPSPVSICHQPSKANPVAFHSQIKIPGLPLQQEIADNSTDEI